MRLHQFTPTQCPQFGFQNTVKALEQVSGMVQTRFCHVGVRTKGSHIRSSMPCGFSLVARQEFTKENDGTSPRHEAKISSAWVPGSLHSPYDEVEVRECQHEDADKGGDGAVEHRLKHLLQTALNPSGAVTQTRQETLPRGGRGLVIFIPYREKMGRHYSGVGEDESHPSGCYWWTAEIKKHLI